MSLLDTLEFDPQAREVVRDAAQRRLRYLSSRAAWRAELGEEAPGANDAWPDRALWAQATLWMDAIETALFIGDAWTARELMPDAIRALDSLGHPLGRALQQAFLPARPQRQFDREASPTVGAPSARVWAEFIDRRWFELPERHPGGRSTRSPVGRMGVPVADVLLVARWRATDRDDTEAEPEGAAAVLQRLLDQQYTALVQARQNTHLWHRLLVPAPLFDLELAVLLAAGMTQRGSDRTPTLVATLRLLPEVQRFGNAYVEAVNQLRG